LEIAQQATGDFVVEAEGGFTVALDPTVTPELRSEGHARELVSRIQRLRKDSGFDVSDRVKVGVTAPDEVSSAGEGHREFITGEVLAVSLEFVPELSADAFE